MTLLCASLLGASAWMLAVPGAPARHTGASRLPVAPQMNSDGLSAEFQRLVNQRSGAVFGHPSEILREQRADSSWVLLFNVGEVDEGVYTLQGRETGEVTRQGTYVLGFARQEEANRYSMLLHAQGFDMATATEWPAEQVSDFCAMAEFGLGFVPDDALLVPPQRNYFDVNAFEEEEEGNWGEDSAELRNRLDKLLDL
jgi:hypothetical protein